MKKYKKDGKVAVLYTPSYGGGWYTWNTDYPECVFDPEIVQLVLEEEDPTLIANLARDKWGEDFYISTKMTGEYGEAKMDLDVKWLPEGTIFEIEEYDGKETVRPIYAKQNLLRA